MLEGLNEICILQYLFIYVFLFSNAVIQLQNEYNNLQNNVTLH